MKTYSTVAGYIADTEKEFVPKLKEMRSLVNKLVPKGEEVIKYGMPTIQLNGKNFIHYAAMNKHLGFYPNPSGVTAVADELKKKGIDFAKGCIRFKYNEKLPTALITKIIKFRLKEERAGK